MIKTKHYFYRNARKGSALTEPMLLNSSSLHPAIYHLLTIAVMFLHTQAMWGRDPAACIYTAPAPMDPDSELKTLNFHSPSLQAELSVLKCAHKPGCILPQTPGTCT